MRDVKQVVCRAFEDHLGLPIGSVNPENEIGGLGADSLDVVEVCMIIEDGLDIDFDAIYEDDLDRAQTVQDVIKVFEGRLQ